MKKVMIATILSLTFSISSSFACPNLAGLYAECSKTSDPKKPLVPSSTDGFKITQTEKDGVTTYEIQDLGQRNMGIHIADGNTRRGVVTNENKVFKWQSTSMCLDASAILKIRTNIQVGQPSSPDSFILDEEVVDTTYFGLTQDNQLTVISTSTLNRPLRESAELYSKIVCKR